VTHELKGQEGGSGPTARVSSQLPTEQHGHFPVHGYHNQLYVVASSHINEISMYLLSTKEK
jgi:hypothetical protein